MPGVPIGNYFTVPGADSSRLGISTSGRDTRGYIATSDIKALMPITADITDFWSMMKYKWEIGVRGDSIFHT